MVDLPAQLQRQVDEIEAYEQAQEVAQAPTEVVEAPAPLTAPEISALTTETPTAAPVETPKPVEENWKARYQTLQGMYNADVPRLTAQLKAAQASLVALDVELKAAKQAPKPAAITAPTVTDKDVEAFGSDLVDLIKRQSRDTITEAEAGWSVERQKLESEIADLKKQGGSVAERQAIEAREKYWNDLGNLVPTYAAVNVDERFMGWLAEVDPLSGITRQRYLENAFETFDASRTAALFAKWITDYGTPAPAAPPAKTAAQQQLERQVAPAGSKATTPVPSSNDDTRTWSPAEIDQFYRAGGRGEYRGREAEYNKIEASIDLAVSQGRVST